MMLDVHNEESWRKVFMNLKLLSFHTQKKKNLREDRDVLEAMFIDCWIELRASLIILEWQIRKFETAWQAKQSLAVYSWLLIKNMLQSFGLFRCHLQLLYAGLFLY